MSRFSEGECESNYAYLWPARVQQVIDGKRGQRILRELIDALLALPERRLIAGAIAKHGEVCAVGALAKKRGVELTTERDVIIDGKWGKHVFDEWEGGDQETAELGASLGMTWTLAWEIGYKNDVEFSPVQMPMKSVVLDVPIINEPVQGWGIALSRPRPQLSAYVPDYNAARWARGYSPEERWQAVYDWACSKVRWQLPVAT